MIRVNGVRLRPERIAVVALALVTLFYVFNMLSSPDGTEVAPTYDDPPHHGKPFKYNAKKCPDYLEFLKHAHAPHSPGLHQYPYMRPTPECRTFASPAVEKVIADLKRKLRDPDLARLVENCLPNTLDTTILWHNPDEPQTFVVTGDIHAEWLRDAARQLAVYQPMAAYDRDLARLMVGAISTQAFYVVTSPYCNAFHPPPGSGVKRGSTARDNVYPKPDWSQVFECKYELDSLASFLTLSNDYYELTGDSLFLNKRWWAAYEKILVVMKREQVPSFDPELGQALRFYYSFKRNTDIGLETLPLGGVGNPVNGGTGLVRLAFRPSDDATILQFFVPGNIHAVTELKRTQRNLLKAQLASDSPVEFETLTEVTTDLIESITRGLNDYAIVTHPKYGRVYAYEVDGYGGSVFMDDANIPSLLAMPDMGYVPVNDEVYQNTRKMILEKNGNPYYLEGRNFEGIGGPHVGIQNAWPMLLLVKIRTSNDDDEIMNALAMVMKSTGGLGLMHETVHVNSPGGMDYTRPWFAWCNSEFGKTILHLAKHKPHLIFKKEFHQPYDLKALFK